MKKTLLLCLLVYSANCHAQYDTAIRYRNASISYSVAWDTLIRQASDPSDTGEESRTEVMERQKYFMGSRISTDVAVGADMTWPMSIALSAYMSHYNDYCPGTGYTGNWQCLGPFIDYYDLSAEGQGRIDAVWSSSADTSTILAGSDGGGLWKTNDGGRNWRNITDGAMGTGSSVLGMAGVSCITVNPYDTNRIYVALGGRIESKKSGGYSLGLAYTSDGGASWHSDDAFNSLVASDHIAEVTKVAYMPGTQQLFAISETKVLYKASPTGSWTDITPSSFTGGSRWGLDMEFTQDPAGKVVVSFSALSGGSYLCVFDPGTSTWSYVSMTLPSPYSQADYSDGPVQISLSSTDIAYIHFRAHNGTDVASLFIKTPITAFSPTTINTALTSYPGITVSGATFHDLKDFVVSPCNSDIIYAVNYSDGGPIFQSTDGGVHFYAYSEPGHSDGRCVLLIDCSSIGGDISDVVYFGNDGGIRKKSKGHNYFHSITGKGLAVTEFFGFGNTEADDGIMAAGAQDNGGFAYKRTNTEPWEIVVGGLDGYTAKFSVDGSKKAFGEYNNAVWDLPHGMYGLDFSGSSIAGFTVNRPADSAVSNINRPQYFSPDGLAHVGYCHIWKKDLDPSSNWSRNFAADPIDHGSYAAKKLACDFYIDEQNTNNAYIAYRDPSGASNDPSLDTFGKLYVSANSASTDPLSPPLWTNITPSICNVNGINSIAVDPSNSNRIWVGFGNINNNYAAASPDTMKYRVWYSDNSGSTWSDVSKGLSGLPVGKLIYRKGSSDELYAGTDAGVFKWNTALSEWECYNNGLPPCAVMDMEFNYCSNKLRIATFGRGIWETQMEEVPPATVIISSNTTWNTDKWFPSSIHVNLGVTLNINNCTLHMPKDGVIQVEPGGHLAVTNSTITNDCENCMWQGIQAWGNTYAPQTPAYQAWVTINNSTIQHAKVGVCCYKPEGPGEFEECGGIIQAANSYFINNANSVYIPPYNNSLSSTPPYYGANINSFTRCVFINDNNFKGRSIGVPFTSHVKLEGVDGVKFFGCSFINRIYAVLGTGNGIDATDASFNATPYCGLSVSGLCPATYPCYFRGLMNGALVQGVTGPGQAVSIDQGDFDSCGVGINVSAYDWVSATRNKIIVGRGYQVPALPPTGTQLTCGWNVGIMIQNSNAFTFEGNIITGRPTITGLSPWDNIGTIINGTGSWDKTVYRSTFDSLTTGVLASGNNHATKLPPWGGADGLRILCNTFYNNTNDIVSTGDWNYEGIGMNQGSHTAPAGNTFSGSVKNIVNTDVNSPILYYYYNDPLSGEVPIMPITNVTALGTLYPVSCPTSFSTVKPMVPWENNTPTRRIAFRHSYDSTKHQHDSLVTQYTALMDNGDLGALIAYIDTVASASALYKKLTSISPYLSDSVLKEMVTTGPLSYDQEDSVLKKNPEALQHYDLMAYMTGLFTVLQSGSQLPDYVTDITNAASGITERTYIEGSVHDTKMAEDNIGNIILMGLKWPIDTNVDPMDTTGAGICMDSTSIYYMQDSNSYYAGMDSVDAMLQAIGEPWTVYDRIAFYNDSAHCRKADTIFRSINQLALTPTELLTYNTYDTLWGVLYGATRAGRNEFELSGPEYITLDTIRDKLMTNNTARASINNLRVVKILQILCSGVRAGDFRPGHTTENNPQIKDIKKLKNSKQFFAYPNPSTGIVTFEYNIPDNNVNEGLHILVTNILGATVWEEQTSDSAGRLLWNAGTLSSGVYIYRASNGKEVIATGKVVLLR